MKAVILAGGMGTRISEETSVRPKPMVDIGGMPILWHIMKIYSAFGVHEFVICLGYKGYLIKEYFANYFLHRSDVTFDMELNQMTVHEKFAEPWKVTLVDTGQNTGTAGRLLCVADYLDDGPFYFTYGDGVGDVDIAALTAFHKAQGRLVTVTAVQPPGRFGRLSIEENQVVGFQEKPQGDGNWINGGYFVVERGALEYIGGDDVQWESESLLDLSSDGQLAAYRHHGFWQPMDTLRDRNNLEELWASGSAPWKVW